MPQLVCLLFSLPRADADTRYLLGIDGPPLLDHRIPHPCCILRRKFYALTLALALALPRTRISPWIFYSHSVQHRPSELFSPCTPSFSRSVTLTPRTHHAANALQRSPAPAGLL
ncbi:hypothetical protein B0H13DRAFT_2344903 [Mycena leptocephala]|nr:hypothetical protein B0H13DRAFT_2344903 [Mycena leptocephala]